jgi:hypothetical protein
MDTTEPWQCDITICAELHRRGLKGLGCPTIQQVSVILAETVVEPDVVLLA